MKNIRKADRRKRVQLAEIVIGAVVAFTLTILIMVAI